MSRSPTIIEELLYPRLPRKDRAEHADIWYVRARARAKISYHKYFVVSIIQCRKYFVIFNFVVLSDYENISITKISGFTVLRLYCSYWSQKWTDLNGECGLTVCYARLFAIVQAERDQNKCLVQNSVVSVVEGICEYIEVYGNTIPTFRSVRS